MSALGQKRISSRGHLMSAIPPKADMQGCCDRMSRIWLSRDYDAGLNFPSTRED